MRIALTALAAGVLLAACGDPLAEVDRIADVDLVETEAVREALASPDELQREAGIFEELIEQDVASVEDLPEVETSTRRGLFGLFRGKKAPVENTSAAEPEVAVASTEITENSNQGELAVKAPLVAKKQTRFLGFLKRQKPELEEEQLAVIEETVEAEAAEAEPSETEQDETFTVAEEPVGPEQSKKSRGLLGLFATKEKAVQENVQLASLEPDAGILSEAPRRSLVDPEKADRLTNGSEAGQRDRANVADVSVGTVLPFGEVGRVCDVKKRDLGKRIEKAGQGGRYALHDTMPEGLVPRTFYVTGFEDGCPRQFTAALAMFGAPSMHEQLRYGRPSEEYPYSLTDKAYEKVKSAICRVGRRKPCGNKITTLERNTVFISTYERFKDNGRWADILLHDGAVMAAAVKDPE